MWVGPQLHVLSLLISRNRVLDFSSTAYVAVDSRRINFWVGAFFEDCLRSLATTRAFGIGVPFMSFGVKIKPPPGGEGLRVRVARQARFSNLKHNPVLGGLSSVRETILPFSPPGSDGVDAAGRLRRRAAGRQLVERQRPALLGALGGLRDLGRHDVEGVARAHLRLLAPRLQGDDGRELVGRAGGACAGSERYVLAANWPETYLCRTLATSV